MDLWRLAEYDDTVLAALVKGHPVPPPVACADLHPVYFGSAITGAGVDDLVTGITTQLPPASGDPQQELNATVFKVDRGERGEKIAYLRMAGGTLRVRDVLAGDRVTGIDLFADGQRKTAASLSAGQIGAVHGLTSVRIGDAFGVREKQTRQPHFAPPALETEVLASRPGDRPALHAALSELAEQDPLIGLRRDGIRMYVSLYGEVQKEVIESTLAEQYGLAVTFRETTTRHIERPVGVGEAVEFNKVDPNPFLATVGLRVEPAAAGTTTFALAVEPGSMPPAFFKAVEETVHQTLRRGPHGWPVDAIAVTMTHSGYSARQSHAHAVFDKSMSSTAGDFRGLTPRVLMAALQRAGTRVLQPVHAFRAEFPPDTLPVVLPELVRLRAVPLDTTPGVIEGEIPAARVQDLRRRLPGLTRGEGLLDVNFGLTTWVAST
jgi:ribosomal protection tetracycline resistance protein